MDFFAGLMNIELNLMNAVLVVILVGLMILMFRIVRDKDNTLEAWHFVATANKDGKYVSDLDKLGKLVGIFIGSWAVIKVAAESVDMTGFALVLGTYFAFVGGIAGYSAYLRSRTQLPVLEDSQQMRRGGRGLGYNMGYQRYGQYDQEMYEDPYDRPFQPHGRRFQAPRGTANAPSLEQIAAEEAEEKKRK